MKYTTNQDIGALVPMGRACSFFLCSVGAAFLPTKQKSKSCAKATPRSSRSIFFGFLPRLQEFQREILGVKGFFDELGLGLGRTDG